MRRVLLALLVCSSACSQTSQRDQAIGFERTPGGILAHGERLSRVLGCSGCHGKDLAGNDWSDDMGVLWTANLTLTARKWTAAQFQQTLVTGKEPGGRELWDMPSYLFTQLTQDELDAVTAYVRSRPATGVVHPRPQMGPFLQAKQKEGVYRSSAAEVGATGKTQAPHVAGLELARHIARATCAECHGIDLRGRTNPIDGRSTPDIRPLAASYSPEDFERLLTTGVAAGGREVGLMSEVARGRYKHLTTAERSAIHAYLRALAIPR
ncbi:c-type cytochrome [Novosphingobium sp.]|uniref:c-type cytochrome n=1 Tax=Novosphingobium sp. TaxID=1874826 RepID=UPI0025E6B0F6|nr:c-type cytochrome [Novosphingobium sp.]